MGIAVIGLVTLAGPLWAAGATAPEDSAPLVLRHPEPGSAPATAPLTLPSAPAELRRVAIGFNDLGGQLRVHLRRDWAVEGRFVTGSANSDVGQVHANVFGMRGYRFFASRRPWRWYAGAEGDYVHTSLRSVDTSGTNNSVTSLSGFGETSGFAFGAFGGVEYRFMKRLAIDFDIGPYLIGLQEKVTRVSDSTLDFVANTAINVYLF